MTEALRRGAAEEVRGIGFDLLLAGWDVADIFDFVIAPAFDTLGRQWSEGSLHIYQERRAVEVCRQLIDDLRRKTTNSHPESAAPRAIHATLAGDPYVLPNAMIDLVLRTAGWRTDNIGRGLPLQSVCAAVRDLKPQLLVLSISQLPTDLFNHWPELSRCTDEIGARTIAGGQALNPAILNRLGQEPHDNTMRHLAALVR
jgi:methanogenic corrinoid protein MtbC1